jgi:hypothetical protein
MLIQCVDNQFMFTAWAIFLSGKLIWKLRCAWSKLCMFIYLNFPPPLWSTGQSSWPQVQRFRVRFLVLPDFLRSCGPRTGSTQPREELFEWKVAVAVWKPEINGLVDPLCWPCNTSLPAKVGINFIDHRRSPSRYSRLRTESHGVCFVCFCAQELKKCYCSALFAKILWHIAATRQRRRNKQLGIRRF